MLVELTIDNFAIIDHLHLKFSPGFNILTGETGAGKSIIVDAMSLVLGGRASEEVIRTGAEQSRIEAIIAPPKELYQAYLRRLLEENGLAADEDLLILSREINRQGRNVCRVNGAAVPLRVLEQFGEVLVDIHGQSEHLSLKRVRQHLEYLDRYAGVAGARAKLAVVVTELYGVRRELQELQKNERELARRADLLKFQVEEIAAAKLGVGEEGELEHERTVLANAERLTSLADEAYRLLYESEDEEQKSALDLLSDAARALEGLVKLDPALNEQQQNAQNVIYQIEELARVVRAYRDGIDYSPARLAEVEERLDLIHRLKRKYGDSIEAVLRYGEQAEQELNAITHSEERIAELQAQEVRLLEQIGGMAQELSRARHEAAARLAAAIEAELADLRMERAKFVVDMQQSDDPTGAPVDGRRLAFDTTGVDRVEFLVSANPGEPPKPLVKVASGGETSRLMLGLKNVLSAADEVPTLIFDEIDVGIGGRVGGIVGRKLWNLTQRPEPVKTAHQVICVTHLPQIAAYGDLHLRVDKEIVGEHTRTVVRELDDAARVSELAQMLGALTEKTQESAEEMLEEVSRIKEVRPDRSRRPVRS